MNKCRQISAVAILSCMSAITSAGLTDLSDTPMANSNPAQAKPNVMLLMDTSSPAERSIIELTTADQYTQSQTDNCGHTNSLPRLIVHKIVRCTGSSLGLVDHRMLQIDHAFLCIAQANTQTLTQFTHFFAGHTSGCTQQFFCIGDHDLQVGNQLEVELERKGARWIYEIKIIRPGGGVAKLKLDARDASLLAQRERH